MEAFELRLWDGRIGRWLTVDPYAQYDSPYLGMGNNPVNSIDPDGGWETKFGAWWHSLWNGGRVGQDTEFGDYFVYKDKEYDEPNTVGGFREFGGQRYNNFAKDQNPQNIFFISDLAIGVSNGIENMQTYINDNSSGIAWYGNSSLPRGVERDYGRTKGKNGKLYFTDDNEIATPGGLNGGGGTVLNNAKLYGLILNRTKHFTAGVPNGIAAGDKIDAYNQAYEDSKYKSMIQIKVPVTYLFDDLAPMTYGANMNWQDTLIFKQDSAGVQEKYKSKSETRIYNFNKKNGTKFKRTNY
jgi:hypothetical protein